MLELSHVADANLENLHHHLAGVSWCDRQALKYQPTGKLIWSVVIGRQQHRSSRGSRGGGGSRIPCRDTQVFLRRN